jgi:hypothetical protein
MGLDATPAGRPLYEKKGFEVVSHLNRWEGQCGVGKRKASTGDWTALLTEDRTTFGCDRSTWLRRLARDSRVAATEQGFGMMRHGAKARYLGPVLALNADAGMEIIDLLTSEANGETVYWDAPEEAPVSPSRWGFVRQRPLYRMILGKPLPQKFSQMIAIADPATG